MSGSENSTPPGWFPAEGDPPGTQRYWDGSQWVGGPQPVAGAGPTMAGAFMGGRSFTEASQATSALVCAILGIFCCQLLAPVGWYLGHQEVAAIDSGRRDPANRGTAQAAKVIGIIMTALAGAFILFYIAAIGFAGFS